MEKKILFSIGEIAKSAGVTRRIILNYEDKGLITPDKKDGNTGNRYYTIDTYTQIRAIRIFQNLGLSLDEIREYFKEHGDLKPVIKRLEDMRNELNAAIEKLKERSVLNGDAVEITTIPQEKAYCRRYNETSLEKKTSLLRDTALEAMRLYGTDRVKCKYYIEYSIEAPSDILYCVVVPEDCEGEYIEILPERRVISVYHHGAYEEMYKSRQKLIDYAKENNIKLTGIFRHYYLEGPPQHKDKNRFITKIIAVIE